MVCGRALMLDGTAHRGKNAHSHPYKDCAPAALKHLPRIRTKPPAQRRPLTSALFPQPTVHQHSPRKPHASVDRAQAPHKRHSWHGDARPMSATSCCFGWRARVGSGAVHCERNEKIKFNVFSGIFLKNVIPYLQNSIRLQSLSPLTFKRGGERTLRFSTLLNVIELETQKGWDSSTTHSSTAQKGRWGGRQYQPKEGGVTTTLLYLA